MVAMITAVPQHQPIRKDPANDHIPGFLVGKCLPLVYQAQLVCVSAKQVHNPHATRALHHDIAKSLSQILAVLQRVIVALSEKPERFQYIGLDWLEFS